MCSDSFTTQLKTFEKLSHGPWITAEKGKTGKRDSMDDDDEEIDMNDDVMLVECEDFFNISLS